MGSGGAFLYPNVTVIPPKTEGPAAERGIAKGGTGPSEFDHLLRDALSPSVTGAGREAVTPPLKFSAHAMQRLHDRKIELDPAILAKVRDAVDKAAAKGIEDTLVITDKAALIVSVTNRTVITAMDKASMSGNVFSNIDGAVIV